MELMELLKRHGVHAVEARVQDFEDFVVNRLWNDYITNCMEIEKVYQTQLNALHIAVPNGTVNKEYSAHVVLPTDLAKSYRIEGIQDTGLMAVNQEDGSVSIYGTPTEAGTYEVRLVVRHARWVEGMREIERRFSLTINADPRSLWKSIPTPTDIPFYKEDEECEYVKVEEKDGKPQKDIVAASKRGRSHAHEGKPRDDHFKLHYCEQSGWYIIAVADGAGSAKYSREGSRVACETAVQHCINSLENIGGFEENIRLFHMSQADNSECEARKMVGDEIYRIIGNAALKAHKAIVQQASQTADSQPKDFATTLLLTMCKQFDFGWFVASFWVGDGAVAIYNKDKQTFRLLGTPDEGEFSGQTRFLTMPEIFTDPTSFYSRLRFSIEEDFTALMLMTDGISDPKFETDNNLNNIAKWNELWDDITREVELTDDNEKSQYQLLRWLDFWSPGNHDDRTIAILY